MRPKPPCDTFDTPFCQANPILPKGSHALDASPRIKYSRVTRPLHSPSLLSPSIHILPTPHPPSPLLLRDTTAKEFALQDSLLLYKRIDNSQLSFLPRKASSPCSIFFPLKCTLAKKLPIFQYLRKINSIPSYSSAEGILRFDSSFQSGNLLAAFAVRDAFVLLLQNDTNTRGCTQWFYFSASARVRGKYVFRIINFYKPTSLYQRGMKVVASNDGVNWHRTGTAISYVADGAGRSTLSFLYDFDQVDRPVYFAYGYPYTTLDLEKKLLRVGMRRAHLCRSAMGNLLPLLTVNGDSNRPIIYVVGRQHPGQTPASYVFEGLLDCLQSNRAQCVQLREQYQFRLVPMVNVDGVVSGNYRSSCAGSDLNRVWQSPSPQFHPEVFALKQDILARRKRIALFLDLHAHSRKMNSFFYGSKHTNRLYPFICSRLNRHISYSDCAFADDIAKRSTARVVVQQESDALSLTFECSFYGWENQQGKGHFKIADLHKLGETLCISLYYSLIGIAKLKTPPLKNGKESKNKHLLTTSIKLKEKWIKQQESQEDDKQSQGSSLDPQGFQLDSQEQMALQSAKLEPSAFPCAEDSLKERRDLSKEGSLKEGGSLLGLSSKEFFKLPTLKQLESQLSLKDDNPYRSPFRVRPQKQAPLNVSTLNPFAQKFQSLDASLRTSRNYKVEELRLALHHMLGTDCHQTVSCVRFSEEECARRVHGDVARIAKRKLIQSTLQ